MSDLNNLSKGAEDFDAEIDENLAELEESENSSPNDINEMYDEATIEMMKKQLERLQIPVLDWEKDFDVHTPLFVDVLTTIKHTEKSQYEYFEANVCFQNNFGIMQAKKYKILLFGSLKTQFQKFFHPKGKDKPEEYKETNTYKTAIKGKKFLMQYNGKTQSLKFKDKEAKSVIVQYLKP